MRPPYSAGATQRRANCSGQGAPSGDASTDTGVSRGARTPASTLHVNAVAKEKGHLAHEIPPSAEPHVRVRWESATQTTVLGRVYFPRWLSVHGQACAFTSAGKFNRL